MHGIGHDNYRLIPSVELEGLKVHVLTSHQHKSYVYHIEDRAVVPFLGPDVDVIQSNKLTPPM